jgi:hypothetical protein
VLRNIESDGTQELTLLELERTGEHVLIGRWIPVPVAPGRAVGVIVYRPPDGWDERSPLAESELRFEGEPALYARPEEAPVVTHEKRERVRRGWAF